MKVQIKLGYYGYIVEREDAPTLMEIFSRATTADGSFVEVSLDKVPDLVRIALKEEVKKELVDETAKYSKYWLDERAISDKLRKELAELKGNNNET